MVKKKNYVKKKSKCVPYSGILLAGAEGHGLPSKQSLAVDKFWSKRPRFSALDPREGVQSFIT